MRATVYGPSSGLGAVEPELKVDRTGVNRQTDSKGAPTLSCTWRMVGISASDNPSHIHTINFGICTRTAFHGRGSRAEGWGGLAIRPPLAPPRAAEACRRLQQASRGTLAAVGGVVRPCGGSGWSEVGDLAPAWHDACTRTLCKGVHGSFAACSAVLYARGASMPHYPPLRNSAERQLPSCQFDHDTVAV